MLSQHVELCFVDGYVSSVVRNGYLSQQTIQTGIGDIEINLHKIRDRSGTEYALIARVGTTLS
ncbi:MAG: hypothetical protein ACTS73_00260 [Arsenophonus sp. NEOnobi-MAG3]